MPIYPGSTTNITLYPTTPTELNIALYPPAEPTGGIALVQSASGTTADGSAGLTVPFGGCLVNATLYPYIGHYINGKPAFGNADEVFYDASVWNCPLGVATDAFEKLLPWLADWSNLDPTPTVACSSPVTAGNSVIALYSVDSDIADTPAPTCVGGSAAVLEQTVVLSNGPGAAFSSGINAQANLAGGETGVSVGTFAPHRLSMTILEVSGLADAAAEDTSTNSNGGAAIVFNEVTPASAVNLIVGIGAYATATSDYSSGPASPFVRLGSGIGGANVFQEVVYAIQATATPQSGNMDITLVDDHDSASAAAAFGGA